MPVTVSGDTYKRIEALAAGLSDDRLRDLTIQLRDALVGTLRNTKWGAGNIGTGLTHYTEPVRTPTGGWMVGVGSLDILHRGPAPPHTIKDFLEWYRRTYMPAEKKRRAAEKVIKARKPEISPAAKEAARLRNINVELFGQYRAINRASLLEIDLRDRLYKLRAERNEAVRWGRLGDVAKKDASLRALEIRMAKNQRRRNQAEIRAAELRGQR